jgi:OFA family oxalate/formate antiporter-like MFS transporter
MTLNAADPGPRPISHAAGATDFAGAATPVISRVRWAQLALGILCMAMIANLQYGWTLFVDPIAKTQHWDRASVQWAFTIFVLTETWLVPLKAWFVDRHGPRPIVMLGGVLIALSWGLDSIANSLLLLYVAAFIGGLGAAAIYGTCVGNALKWFPDRRGLAAGATAAGFGAGAALTVVPIGQMIATSGYQKAFLFFGLGQGLVVLVAALFLHAPNVLHPAKAKRLRIAQSKRNFKPDVMVRKPVFWLLYVIFVMVAAGGLMMAAQLAPIANDYGIAKTKVVLLGLSVVTLTFALSADRILDGIGRPLFGLLSDRIGREPTMFIAFAFGALMLGLLATMGHQPIIFIFATAFYFLVFGEIYSLFPATCGDTFGPKYAATNSGLLYTAKGTAALLVPFASSLSTHHGWQAVFFLVVGLNTTAALLALFVLRPLRHRFIDQTALMN